MAGLRRGKQGLCLLLSWEAGRLRCEEVSLEGWRKPEDRGVRRAKMPGRKAEAQGSEAKGLLGGMKCGAGVVRGQERR